MCITFPFRLQITTDLQCDLCLGADARGSPKQDKENGRPSSECRRIKCHINLLPLLSFLKLNLSNWRKDDCCIFGNGAGSVGSGKGNAFLFIVAKVDSLSGVTC